MLRRDEGGPAHPAQSPSLGTGRHELVLTAPDGARVLLLGGTPFEESIVMWWNFVGRSREEVEQATASWTAGDDRFGSVATALPRVPAPVSPPGLR